MDFLDKRNVARDYIHVISDMYEGAETNVRNTYGDGSEFSITIGLHYGSTLSRYLFALIMDKSTTHIQEELL